MKEYMATVLEIKMQHDTKSWTHLDDKDLPYISFKAHLDSGTVGCFVTSEQTLEDFEKAVKECIEMVVMPLVEEEWNQWQENIEAYKGSL